MTLLGRKEAPHSLSTLTMGEIEGKQIYNVSCVGFPLTNISPRDSDYLTERTRALTRNTDDGVKPMTKEEQDFERSVSWKLVKAWTLKVFSMDFTRLSFPVAYSEERSFLERTCDLFTFLVNIYIEKAMKETNEQEKLILLTTGVVAGFHLYLASKKPFNPIIGETYVGHFQNGTTIYAEQQSHHPPISNFQIYGPNNSWYCYAQCRFSVSSGIFQIDIPQRGTFHLEFKDGHKYEWEFPAISITGILRGDRIVKVKGPFIMKDINNGMECNVEIAPKENKSIGLSKTRQTTIYGGIRAEGSTQYIKTMIGDYTEKVVCGGKIIWDINRDISQRPLQNVNEDELLLSDCRFRMDRGYFILHNDATADKIKLILEKAQGREENMRERRE